MAKDQGKPLSENEYLYMTACMDYLREVHRAKTLELRLHIERFENEQLSKQYPENQPKPETPKTEKTEEANEDGHKQDPEGDRV